MPGMNGQSGFPATISLLCLALIPLVAAIAYAVGVVRLTRRGDRWPRTRSIAAATGFAVLTAALMPPMDSSDFPVTVVRHLMIAMLAPFALALSAPVTLALRTLPPAGRRRLLGSMTNASVRSLTSAPMILVLDVGGMYAYYLSPLFAAGDQHPWMHLAVHVHMFLAGWLLSWYVVARDPIHSRPSVRTRLVVLLIAAAAHDVLAKLMYAHLLPAGGGTPAQLRAGAQLLFYGGEAMDIALTCAVMLAWYRRAGRQLTAQSGRAPVVGVS